MEDNDETLFPYRTSNYLSTASVTFEGGLMSTLLLDKNLAR